MKVRNGFVSNSSSSSFIMGNSTTASAMYDLIRAVLRDCEIYFNPVSTSDNNFIRTFESEYEILTWLSQNLDCDEPLLFSGTCNYETFMIKDKSTGRILVDTCNNHDWTGLDIINHNDDDNDGTHQRYQGYEAKYKDEHCEFGPCSSCEEAECPDHIQDMVDGDEKDLDHPKYRVIYIDVRTRARETEALYFFKKYAHMGFYDKIPGTNKPWSIEILELLAQGVAQEEFL